MSEDFVEMLHKENKFAILVLRISIIMNSLDINKLIRKKGSR